MGEGEISKPTLGPTDAWIDAGLVAPVLPRRRPGAHKWQVGGVIVVAGAPHYVGAAILSSTAAARAGAGVVVVASSRAVGTAVVQRLPEAVTLALPESESATSSRRVAEIIETRLERSAALVIGPGLGDDEAASAVMHALIGGRRTSLQRIGFGPGSREAAEQAPGLVANSGKPAVIDADGLNWLAKYDEWWTLLPPRQIVLTPHPTEFSRLRGIAIEEVLASPLESARAAAKDWQQTVVLKAGYVVVTDGDRAYVAPEAPTALATAGSGDVLAGSIGGLLAQGVPAMEAAALAVYVGNAAAATLTAELSTLGLLASDLPRAIAVELARLERGQEASGG